MLFRSLSHPLSLVLILNVTPSSAQNPGGISVGLKPLTELGSSLYKGYAGGLYLGSSNSPPAPHDSAGREIARQVLPLDRSGLVDMTNGKIVLLSVGMSNTTQEFSAFKALSDADALKNPRLVIVDGAQGGQTASIIANPAASFWTVIDQRLQAAGVTRQQIQAAWIKEADAGPTSEFPTYARILSTELEAIARILKSFYPNIRIAYLSSRIYAGYATSTLNPEPYAYESAFSVKWLIEKQIDGDTSLAYASPHARAPWLSWGPYLWADGLTPRSDGLTWQATDFQTDGTHPSPNGQKKVASLLLNFFKTDPTSASWFLKAGATNLQAEGPAGPDWQLSQNYPNPFNPVTTIRLLIPEMSRVSMRVFNVRGEEVAVLMNDIRPAGNYSVPWNARALPSGVYFCRLVVTAARPGTHSIVFVDSKPMLLLK